MKEWEKVKVPSYVEKKAEGRLLIEVCVESGSGTIVAEQHVKCTIKRDQFGKFVRNDVVRDKDGEYESGGDFVHEPIKMLIYKSQLAGVMAGVRSEKHWAELRSARRHFEAYMLEKTRRMSPDERQREALREGHSPEAMLRERGFKTGIPSLISVKVLDDSVPPPDTQAAREARREDKTAEILDAIRAILEQRSGGGNGDRRDHNKR